MKNYLVDLYWLSVRGGELPRTSLAEAEKPWRVLLKCVKVHPRWILMRNSKTLTDLKFLKIWGFLSRLDQKKTNLTL